MARYARRLEETRALCAAPDSNVARFKGENWALEEGGTRVLRHTHDSARIPAPALCERQPTLLGEAPAANFGLLLATFYCENLKLRQEWQNIDHASLTIK